MVSTRNGQKNGLWHHPMWKLNSVALAETCWNTAIVTLLALKTANKISGKNSAPTQEIMAPAMPSWALACANHHNIIATSEFNWLHFMDTTFDMSM